MVTNKIIICFILLITLSQCTSCDPLAGDNGPVYNFFISVSISPSSDTINVGDTLYFISTFPSHLTDAKTGKIINYSNSQPIVSSIGFNDFTKFGTLTDSCTTKDFLYFPIEGDVYNDKTLPVYWNSNQIRFEEKNENYNLKIGIIPSRKGMYYFGISDPYSNGLIGTKDYNVNSANFFITFAHTNQHLHYFEDKYGPLSENDKGRVFCFVVE